MRFLPRALLLLAGVSLLLFPRPSVSSASVGAFHPLTRQELVEAHHASAIALKSTTSAMHWLRAQPDLQSVSLGADGTTMEIRFKDGHQILTLARGAVHSQPRISFPRFVQLRHVTGGAANDPAAAPKAAVLMPFASELNEGANAGQAEVDALQKAGFQVDVFRNQDVTIDLMTTLGSYSAVYMESHSGLLANGDAILVTGSTDGSKYKKYLPPAYAPGGDNTVQPAIVDGATGEYLAIVAGFIQQHMNSFPDSSLLYFDGCDLLSATKFWGALQAKNADTMVSWDNHIFSSSSELAAQYMFSQLASGETVSQSLDATGKAGMASGYGDQGIAHLGYLGDGADTLALSLSHATPIATPTETPTATSTPDPPTPTATPKKLPRTKCKHGKHRIHGGKCMCKRDYKMSHGKCRKVKKKHHY